MRAFIHTVGGRPFNEECASAQRGFEKLGIECVFFASNDVLDTVGRDDILVGGMLVCSHVLSLMGVEPPALDYPDTLRKFHGREFGNPPLAS